MKSPALAPSLSAPAPLGDALAVDDVHDHASRPDDHEPHAHEKESGCGNGCRSCPRCASRTESKKV